MAAFDWYVLYVTVFEQHAEIIAFRLLLPVQHGSPPNSLKILPSSCKFDALIIGLS